MNSLSSAAAAGVGFGLAYLLIYAGIIILYLVIAYIVAKKFEQIAIEKGYPNVHAFAMCFWLGIVGYLYVIALPNKKQLSPTPSHRPPKAETASSGATVYRCPRCNEMLYQGVDTCPNCHQGIYWGKQ